MKHDGWANTYSLVCVSTRISLLPSKEIIPKPRVGEGTSLLTKAQFEEKVAEAKVIYVLIAMF